MNTIILDSSNKYLLVAYAKDDVIVDKICYEAWQRQSELMVTELEKILKRNKKCHLRHFYCNSYTITPGPTLLIPVPVAMIF